MFFSRALLRTDKADLAELSRLAAKDTYRAHQLVWDLFGDTPDRKRDYLYRRETVDGQPIFYIVSQRPPAPKNDFWDVVQKDYAPQIEAGEQFAFRVRVNPVVQRLGDPVLDESGQPKLRTSIKRAGEIKRKVVRHDVVMAAKTTMGDTWDEKFKLVRWEEAARGWLGDGDESRCSRHGFSLENLSAHSYIQHRIYRRKQEPIRFSTLELEGALTVLEPSKFREMLFKGIGPAKGFGCGLLLVRRV